MEAKPTNGLKNRTRTSVTLEPILLAKLRENTLNISKIVGKKLTEYTIEKGFFTKEEAQPLCKTYEVNYDEVKSRTKN